MYTPPSTTSPRRPSRRLTARERADVIGALKAGGSVTAVAAQFGLDRATVRCLRDGAEARDPASATATRVVTCRVSVAELSAFEARLPALGLGSRSEGLRAAVRAAGGLLEFSGAEHDRLDALTLALHRLGVNINQLVRLANAGRLPAGSHQLEVLSDLRRDLAQLRAYMADMTAERRRRGVKLFERFLRAERDHG